MVRGVPPRMYPTLKSCNSSPATDAETQTTAATPNTAATPGTPDTPSETMRSAAMISVESVKPDTGLLDDPIIPTKLPDTVEKKKPTMSITTAARIAGQTSPVMWMYRKHINKNIKAISPKTAF